MGIRGLTTYMNWSYWRQWRTIEVRGRLIIDAMSVCFVIHENNRIDWLHGGQYWELRQSYKRFITSLLESGIEPIVIFDGIDYTGKKSGVMLDRKESARQAISDILDKDDAESNSSTGSSASRLDKQHDFSKPAPSQGSTVIPLFAQAVFCETLRELGVRFVYADGDADSIIASIANYYSCPVVSNDSDFFFFNIRAGYIPFYNLHWEQQPVTAQVYYYLYFVDNFNFKSLEVPLLIPAILGNDYIEPLNSPCLRGDIAVTLLKYRERRGGTRSWRDKTHELILYFKNFSSPDEFLNCISRCCLRNEVSIVEKNLEIAKDFYTVNEFSIKDIMNKSEMTTSNGTALPLWMIQQLRNGQFSLSAMAPVVFNGSVLPNIIDNPKRRSAMFIGLPIRRCMYTILLPLLEESYVHETVSVDFEDGYSSIACNAANEYFRFNLPSITDMEKISISCRIDALCFSLECSSGILNWFEDKWKLVVLSLAFWTKYAVPDIHLIKSLILCFIVCSLDRDPSSHMPHSTDADSSQNNDTLHVFSMWQCVYHDTMKLNNVLMNPLSFTTPALLFDGRLAMYYASLADINNIVRSELVSSLQLLALFKSLMFVCTESLKAATKDGVQYDQTVYFNLVPVLISSDSDEDDDSVSDESDIFDYIYD
uniref:Uncharacterized protein n=1 Tax=Amphimedon queenslandica TaxID=400682 RepID=A0A1X7UUV5_AMPQE